MKNIYLVRHGQASAGTDNYDRLSEIGIEQAKMLGDHWKKCGFQADVAFSGSLERQQHTAQLALDSAGLHPTLTTVEDLNEYDHTLIDQLFGEGVTSDGGLDLSFNQYLAIMQRWHDANLSAADLAAGAISWKTFAERGWNAVQNSVASSHASSLVFFTSGGIIATILQQVMGLGFEPTMHAIWQTRNASVTRIAIDNDSPATPCVVYYNSIPHLQLHCDKSLITQI